MINLCIRGRMGNQLFQYACASTYAKKWNEKLNIYFMNEKNQLKDFNINENVDYGKINIYLYQKIILFVFMVIRRIYSNNDSLKQQKIEKKLQPILNHYGIYWLINGYYDFKNCKCKKKIFIGYFESEKYFIENRNAIIEEFKFKSKISDYNAEFYNEIKKSNSVAISIRRGDFVSIGNIVCGLDYYEKAIKKVINLVDNPVFFAFSDDVEWVKKNVNIPGKVFYENQENTPSETLELMKECKNFIISNSTFHWWAQYLCYNDKKIVVAPKRWHNSKEERNIIQDDWITIDN